MAQVTVQSLANLRQEILSGRHLIIADEPTSEGGNDAGLDPYEIVAFFAWGLYGNDLEALCAQQTMESGSRNCQPDS